MTALVISRGIDRGEFNLHTDEAQHAVTGLFFADFLRDLPLAHPVEYAFRYYAQYPALGLIHWPPLFHLAEGLMFLLVGPSALAARLTVLGFTLVGCAYWFRLVRGFQNAWMAGFSTLLLVLNAELLLYEKSAMLEAPSLAMALAATYYWMQYLRAGGRRLLFRFVACACLALFTKQTTIYLAVFCLLTTVVRRDWRLLRERDILRGILFCLLLLGPFFLAAFLLHGQTISHDVIKRSIQGYNPLLYYLFKLPGQLGLPVLLLSLLGMATAGKWDRRENTLDMGAWILSCYLTFTLLAGKETRYIIYWLPPFMYFAGGFLLAEWGPRWRKVVATAAGVALLGWQFAGAWTYQRPYISGYEATARLVMQKAGSGILLFDGEVPGNFVFFVRKLDQRRQFVVLRKALYASRIDRSFGHEELVSSVDEILQLIRSYGIRYIVVSDSSQYQFVAQRLLREMLKSDDFELLAEQPIEANIEGWGERDLLIYAYKRAVPRTATELRIRMLTLNEDIVVSFKDLGIP